MIHIFLEKIINTLYLVSSNKNKLEEYKEILKYLNSTLLIDVKPGKDLMEVYGSPIDVIKYKSLENGDMTICEDSVLDVEGADIGINVRWLLDSISDYIGNKFTFTTYLALNKNGYIKIYKGSIEGKICEPKGISNFGFDRYVEIDGKSLSEWNDINLKIKYNPRLYAMKNLLDDNYIEIFNISSIEKWNGNYQH